MGTETLNTHHNQSQINGGIVKLNNPLMGTETNAVLMSTTVVVCFC